MKYRTLDTFWPWNIRFGSNITPIFCPFLSAPGYDIYRDIPGSSSTCKIWGWSSMYAKTVIQSWSVRFSQVLVFCSFADVAGASFDTFCLGALEMHRDGFGRGFQRTGWDMVMRWLETTIFFFLCLLIQRWYKGRTKLGNINGFHPILASK